MNKKIFWFLLFAVSVTSMWWLGHTILLSTQEYNQVRGAAHSRQQHANKGGDIGIAAAGDWAAHGSLLNGIQLAVAEINQAGGLLNRTLKLTAVDDHGTLEGAFEASQQICEQMDTLFVIGHSRSNLTQAIVQNYEFYGILMMSPLSANLSQSQKNFQLIFSNSTPLDLIAERLLKLAREKQWSRIGIIYDTSDFDANLAHHFESILKTDQIKIPFLKGIQPTHTNTYIMDGIVSRTKELHLDALIMATKNQDTLKIIRQYRAAGFELPIILGQKPAAPDLKNRPQMLAKTYWPLLQASGSPQFKTFTNAYLELFAEPPDTMAIAGYDSMMMLAQAIKKTNSFSLKKIASQLKTFTPEHSLTGTIGFDSSGNAVKEPFQFITVERRSIQGHAPDASREP